jgi:hypothetical protein
VEWELIFRPDDEHDTKTLLRYVEERAVPEALRSHGPEDADDGSVLLISKRSLGSFPLPRPRLRVTIEPVADATPWAP